MAASPSDSRLARRPVETAQARSHPLNAADAPTPKKGGALTRVYRNAGKLLGGKIAGGLIGLVYLSLAARSLGAHDFGVLVLINFYVLLVGNFCVLQGWHTVVRFGSRDTIADAPEQFQRLICFTARIELLSGLAAMLLAASLSRWAGHLFGWSDALSGLVAIYSLAIVTNMQTTPAGVLNLFGRFDLLSLQQISGPVVRLLGAVVAWFLQAGLEGFLIAWLLGSVAEGLVQWALGLSELRRRGLLQGLWRAPQGVTVRHPGIWRFLLTNNLDIGLTDAGNRITPLAVGAILSPAAVGLYHLALRIGMVLQQPVLLLGRSLYPELAILATNSEPQRLHRLVIRTALIATAGGVVVMLLFLLFGKTLLRTVGGDGFDDAYGVLLLIGLARTVHLLGFPFGSALVALGSPNITLWINIVCTFGLLPVLYFLLRRIGLEGAGLHALAYAALTVVALVIAFQVTLSKSQRSRPPA